MKVMSKVNASKYTEETNYLELHIWSCGYFIQVRIRKVIKIAYLGFEELINEATAAYRH